MCRGAAQQRQQLGQVPGFRRRKLLAQVGRQSLLRALIYLGFGVPPAGLSLFPPEHSHSVRVRSDVRGRCDDSADGTGRGIVHVVGDMPDRR